MTLGRVAHGWRRQLLPLLLDCRRLCPRPETWLECEEEKTSLRRGRESLAEKNDSGQFGRWLAGVMRETSTQRAAVGVTQGVRGLRLEADDVGEVFSDARCLRPGASTADEDAIDALP